MACAQRRAAWPVTTARRPGAHLAPLAVVQDADNRQGVKRSPVRLAAYIRLSSKVTVLNSSHLFPTDRRNARFDVESGNQFVHVFVVTHRAKNIGDDFSGFCDVRVAC